MTTTNNIKFFYNGLKVSEGALIKGHWSLIEAWVNAGRQIETHIVMYCRDYASLPEAVRNEFKVENNTDITTDYFEQDRVRIHMSHPRFFDAAEALRKSLEKGIARCIKSNTNHEANDQALVKLAKIVEEAKKNQW